MSINHQHNCQDMLQKLNSYIDQELEKTLCEELEQHLRDCHDCRVVLDSMRKTIELYRLDENETLPEDVRRRLITRLHLADYLRDRKAE